MEKVLELYKYIDGVNDAKFPNDEEQVVVRDFRYDAKRMGGAPTISFSIKHSLCLDNLWDDHVYAMFNGERYYVKQTPTSSYSNEDTRYKHEVELISERTILDNVYFYDVVTTDVENDKPVSNSSKFSFFGDIHEYVKRVGYSLSWSGLDYTIEIDENIVSEEKQVSFENQVITSVLQEIYNIYQIPYYFDGKVIHVGYYKNNIDHVFKYGAQNSLLSISKTNANAKIVNRITGVGSQDNIPYYYPNDDEKGITRPLLNDSTNGVQIVSASKYRKIRLSDRFIFNQTIQAKTSLIDENNYTLGDLRIGSFKDEKSKFIVDFLYSFTLKQGENVEFSVTSSYEDNVGLSYDMYKKGGNYIGPFSESSKMYLSSGEYSFVVRWSFMAQGTMIEIEETLQSLIATYLNVRAAIAIDAENTWTLNGIPVSLENYGLQVDNPNDGDVVSIEQTSYINPQSSLMPSIYRQTLGEERFYNALNDTYVDESSGETYNFENEYSNNHPKEHIEDFEDIKPTIKNVTNNDGYRIDRFVDFAYDLYDNDEVDEEGKFIHKWFFAKLNKLDGENGFNLFDHAIDESEMIISMTSGSCGSCAFKVLVNKETQKNTVQVDEYGNLLRDNNGNVRFGSPQDRQNDTENYEVWIALEKDIQTFGVIMPNATNNYRPSAGDTFVILHIDLPKSYIEAAEKKLENELIKYMYENNFEKFNFSISFSRIFFAEQPSILANLTENSKLNIEYNGTTYELYVSSLSYAMNSSHPLPEIKVELDDVIAISQNQINQIVASTRKEILAVSNQDVFWKDIKGVPSWITSEKPQYSYNELYGRSAQQEDGVWVVKTDEKGNKYIFSTYPVVTQYGITMYADGGELDLPSIYAGLPIDNSTLIRDDNGVLMINPNIDLGGGLTEVYWNDIKAKPTFATVATSGKYSDLGGLPDLSVYALTKDLEKYVTLETTQTITGEKNFTGGLKVNGSPIVYDATNKYWKLEGDLLVTGGVTMFASDSAFTPSTIMDAIATDGTNLKVVNGVLTFVGSIDGGEAGSVAWENVMGKPSFATVATSGKYSDLSGVPTLLSSFTNDLGFIDSSALSGYLLASNYTASDILAKLLTVDGSGSGLDADLLDGLQPGELSVLSASKLTNARTIWGQSFDGTENVSGNLTLDNNTSILFKDSTGNTKNVFNLNSSNQLFIGESIASSGYPTFISGNIITLRYGKSKAVGLRIDESGRVGVNTSAPAYKLDVIGDIRSTTNVRTPIATIDGIPIYKSQDDVLYIDGNLAVRGGITMYATDAIDVPSIIDSLPIASTSAKGLASFDPNFFSVDANGNVSFIGSTGITEVNWTDVVGRPTLLSSFINDQGFASTLGELSNVGSWADSAPTEGRLLYQAKDSRVWTYKNVSDFVSENGLYLPLTGGVLTGNLEVTSITHSSPYATNIDNFGNLVFGSSGLDWSIKSNDQNKIVTLYNTGKLELNGRVGSDVPLTILSSNNQGLVIRGTATETTINYNSELYGTSWTTGINIKNELPNSYCIYSTTKNENVLKFRGSDGRGFVKFGMEFENSGLTAYASNGITIGGGDDTARYIVCYGKDHGYINLGKSPSVGNTGEISFRYFGNGSQQNMLNFGFYGGSSSEITIYYNSHTQVKGDLLTTGGITMYSDIRKKTKLQNVELSLKQIADAPLIEHYYNSDAMRTTHVGSIAQYWAGINDWFCKLDSEGFYTMEIQNAALASAISIARELSRYETKTDRKIRLLKKRISDLEDKIEQLEMK